jgi:hypothetical protein
MNLKNEAMNKRETIQAISNDTGIATGTCVRILDSLEVVLTHELEGVGGITQLFDHIYWLTDHLRRMQEKEVRGEMSDLVQKVACLSETSTEETQSVLEALAGLLNHRLETSRCARIQYRILARLIDFFRHNRNK